METGEFLNHFHWPSPKPFPHRPVEWTVKRAPAFELKIRRRRQSLRSRSRINVAVEVKVKVDVKVELEVEIEDEFEKIRNKREAFPSKDNPCKRCQANGHAQVRAEAESGAEGSPRL